MLSFAFIRVLGNKSPIDILGGFQKPIKRNRHQFTILGSLSTCDFETRTASGSELVTRLHTITFTLLSTFSTLGMISAKIWETPMSWHGKCSLPVAVRVSKRRVLNGGAYYCYCAYVLRISRCSGFPIGDAFKNSDVFARLKTIGRT